ncbi:hypothetical protein ABZT28_53595 [Streptomyces sp. NPDC005388]|uniref:hypothetical protein n=1 Tax=Streptomyces sp. NPDC005388 TaxID=3156717 RepID=UPI0033AEBD37
MLPYEELTPPERELWDAFPEGRQVDLRAGTPSGDDPAGGADWGFLTAVGFVIESQRFSTSVKGGGVVGGGR